MSRAAARGGRPQRNQPPQVPTQQIQAIVRQEITRVEAHSGPLPHPDILARYNEIVPGLADRIVTMAERQSEHRINLEHEVTTADIKRADRGLGAGLVVAVTGLVVAGVIAVAASPVAGVAIAGLDLVSIVGSFIYGTERRRGERIEKMKIMTGAQ